MRKLIRSGFIALAVVGLGILTVHAHVMRSARNRIFAPDRAPVHALILVLGASVDGQGRPSPMLDERLRAAAELWRRRPDAKVLLSGDGQSPDYDEVAAMARDLLRRGIPQSAILEDRAGLRTFDSLWRARELYAASELTVVSNPFHVPRAVYLGRRLGLKVNGVGADYQVPYSMRTRWTHEAREFAARILAFADLHVLGTRPQVEARLGKPR